VQLVGDRAELLVALDRRRRLGQHALELGKGLRPAVRPREVVGLERQADVES